MDTFTRRFRSRLFRPENPDESGPALGLSRYIGDLSGPVGAVSNPGHDLSDRTGLEYLIHSKIH